MPAGCLGDGFCCSLYVCFFGHTPSRTMSCACEGVSQGQCLAISLLIFVCACIFLATMVWIEVTVQSHAFALCLAWWQRVKLHVMLQGAC